MQRKIGQELDKQTGGVVTEGRDQGSYVFPDAQVKFYLDASPEVRAERRHKELIERGQSVSLPEILQAILQRDMRDQSRQLAPLVRPAGAIVIDNSGRTAEWGLEEMRKVVEQKR
jgi:cytidylate kinase